MIDIVSRVELALLKADKTKANQIKCAISNVLSSHRYQQTKNLTALEYKIINELKKDNTIIITRAGNAVVILDRHAYIKKTEDLSPPAYTSIPGDPTDSFRKAVRQLMESFVEESGDVQTARISKRLKYTANSTSPELYCLPKIHKPGIPFRPIVSITNSPTSHLGRYIAKIIKPLTGQRSSHTLSSEGFLADIKDITLAQDDILVSYDVQDLFTSIPIQYTCHALLQMLSNDVTLKDRTHLSPYHVTQLAKFCMINGNYFHFQGKFFSQNHGAPMGSVLSPVLTELFMENLEEKAFSPTGPLFAIKVFKRYVDDIFAIIQKGSELPFLNHLNSLFPKKSCFTIEVERNGRLPFLDILLLRKQSKVVSQVFRKLTNTNTLIHFQLHHPEKVKIGLITGMVDRAHRLCNPQFLPTELGHIKRTFLYKGFPSKLVNSCITQRLRHLHGDTAAREPTQDIRITVPYYQGISEKI
ncbi:hypothetical protein M513_00833 [Trichuris suis]|uniref:Reverse transcriptase domain-containing protein n=1 Tax=Trichuris suis TaxID=68888 RepID=A0A085MLH4_9BILA|nr:hypothetical protein M513_00833 [Trichuris suis]